MFRYAVFIDGGYIRRILRDGFGEPRISYLKLSELVAHSEERLRTYYYDCAPLLSASVTREEKKRQTGFDRFISAMEAAPRFQVRLGRLARYETRTGARFEQKKVDVLLTVDLIRLSLEHQIHRAVLIAGDSDFVPAIQVARDAGTIVQLYYYHRPNPHRELLDACDERILIDQDFIDSIRQ